MIRLSRQGKKKQPTYRIIVSEKHKDPWGDSLEILGFYNPRTNPATLHVKKERVAHWMGKGAQVSDTIHNLFVGQAILSSPKRRIVHPKKKDGKAEAAGPATTTPKEEKNEPAKEVKETPAPDETKTETPVATHEEKEKAAK